MGTVVKVAVGVIPGGGFLVRVGLGVEVSVGGGTMVAVAVGGGTGVAVAVGGGGSVGVADGSGDEVGVCEGDGAMGAVLVGEDMGLGEGETVGVGMNEFVS